MKIKHNKKRNTAFVYEALVREGTSAILQKDQLRRNKIVSIIKEHFREGSLLRMDLECYRSLSENQNLVPETGHRIIREAVLQKRAISPRALFSQQTKLIHDINKKLEPSVFNNFVPNYKNLATIDQMFSMATTPKNRVILESMIMQNMCAPIERDEQQQVDSLVIEAFVKKFNTKYDSGLLEQQKKLLTCYITSFVDNAVELKTFLNEEISRLKAKIREAKEIDYIREDSEMLEKVSHVAVLLEGLKETSINEKVLLTVLKTQSLVEEISKDGDSN